MARTLNHLIIAAATLAGLTACWEPVAYPNEGREIPITSRGDEYLKLTGKFDEIKGAKAAAHGEEKAAEKAPAKDAPAKDAPAKDAAEK